MSASVYPPGTSSGLAHICGQDLQLGPTGDLAIAQGPVLTQHRLLRRLLTNPGDYIWHTDYGAGLASMVGTPANPTLIQAIILSQALRETGIAPTPAPKVTVQSDGSGLVSAGILYTDAATGKSVPLALPGATPSPAATPGATPTPTPTPTPIPNFGQYSDSAGNLLSDSIGNPLEGPT